MARIASAALLAGFAILLSVDAEAVKPSYTPGVSRAVASGTTDLATAADYLGTIVWRSATASNKTQTLPGCSTLNDGAWIKVVDGQGTASANPIAIAASSGTVVGPASPVEIDLDKGAIVLTCDGASTAWLVTETATVPSTGAGTGDVVGPGAATADHLTSYNGTTGKAVKDSGIAAADVGTLAGNQTVTGTKTYNIQPVFPLTHQKVIMGNASDTATATSLSQDIGCADTGACTVTGLQANKLDTGTPNDGDVLTWHTSGTPAWAPAAPTGGTGAGVSSVASGSPAITISGTGGGPYTGSVTVTQTQPARSTSSAALVSTDGGSVVVNTSGGMTIANATGALGDGYAASALAVAAATLTPTTATINGNTTEPLGINQGISLFSLSGEYYAILGMPEPVASSVLVASSGRVPAWQAGTTSQLVKGDGSLGTLGTMAAQAASSVAITGGTAAGLTGLGIRDTSAAFDLTLAATSSGALTAGHKLTFNVANADRTFKLASNLTVVTDPGGITGALRADGSGTFAQAACADLSNGNTGCSTATGTSGATIGLLNGSNTYSGTNSHTGAETFAEVHGGLPEVVTLSSNDYVAVAGDCGKVKTLPTGTSPTVHLPNLNVGCTITFVTSVAISYQILPASGGTVWSSTGFNKTRGTAAGDIVSATITVNSASAAKWVISGDVTS